MSQAAVGKVGTWLREGRTIPEGWGVDGDGNPTSDPKAILGGAVLPFGGHIGAGIAVMIELLTAALAGAAFGNEIEAGDPSGLDPGSSKLFLAIAPQAFGGRQLFASRVGEEILFAYCPQCIFGNNQGASIPATRSSPRYEANLPTKWSTSLAPSLSPI